MRGEIYKLKFSAQLFLQHTPLDAWIKVSTQVNTRHNWLYLQQDKEI